MKKLLYLLLFCSPLMAMEPEVQEQSPRITKPSRIIRGKIRLKTTVYAPTRFRGVAPLKAESNLESEWVVIEKDN
jgi:hypothetical protein